MLGRDDFHLIAAGLTDGDAAVQVLDADPVAGRDLPVPVERVAVLALLPGSGQRDGRKERDGGEFSHMPHITKGVILSRSAAQAKDLFAERTERSSAQRGPSGSALRMTMITSFSA